MHNQSKNFYRKSACNSRRIRGFTLLELLVVLVIVGTLAALAIPAYNSYVNKAKITMAVSTMDTIRKTLESFHNDYSSYPEPPINFSTGLDNLGRSAFPSVLLEIINKDLSSIDSYSLVGQDYTVTATAKDSDSTVLTLTSQTISY